MVSDALEILQLKSSPIHLVVTLMRLITSLITEIEQSGKDEKEAMSSQQVSIMIESYKFK